MADEKATEDLTKAITKLTSIVDLQTKEIGKVHEGLGVAGGIISTIVGYIKDLTSFGPKLDTLGAKFSTSIEANIKESEKLAKTFVDKGVPAHVWDAMAFNLQTNSLAMDSNSEGLRDLFGVTMATGENYVALAGALGSVTVGTKNQKRSLNQLAATLEDTARRTNMSRESLINAMSKLSDDTLNLMATTAGGSTALTGAMAILKGRIGDEGLVNQMSAEINRMLSPAGIPAAIAAGVPIQDLLSGAGKMGDPEEVAKMWEETFKTMAKRGTGDALGQAYLSNAMKKDLGDINLATRLSNKLAENSLKEAKEINEGFQRTWDMIKKEIVSPLVDEFSELFFTLKASLGGNLGRMIKGALIGIGFIVAGISGIIVKFFSWIADKFMGAWDVTSEWLKKGIGLLTGVKADLDKIDSNTKTTADIQRDRKKEEANKNLSDAIRTQTKFSIHQSKAFPVLLKQLIKEAKEGNRLTRAGGSPGTVVVQSGAAPASPVHFA